MGKTHFHPPLNKRFLGARDGHEIYSIDAFAIRNAAQADEEFGNFATREEFPDLVPEDEIWISNKGRREEGEFFVTHALARLKKVAEGASEDEADSAGLKAERRLRQ